MKKNKKAGNARVELDTEVVADLEASDQETDAVIGGLPSGGGSYSLTRPTKGGGSAGGGSAT